MSIVDLYTRKPSSQDDPAQALLLSRSDILSQIGSQKNFDLLVIGGGIHGAAFARLSAFHGLRTLLIEKNGYGYATSSRSSKMAHGGLRYLEMWDFAQVLGGIRAREDLLICAPHLVRSQKFIVPLFEEQRLFKLKLKMGLTFYDWLVRDRARRHRWRKPQELPFQQLAGKKLLGAFEYSDALMSDVRLVIENIIAARQEGALCINHCSVDSIKRREDGSLLIGWHDTIGSASFETKVGVVVNCAGPWVPQVGRIRSDKSTLKVRYSRGVHLLFEKQFCTEAILRYSERAGQHYFIWPHFAGSLIGPTDKEVDAIELDPQPTAQEIAEILSRLESDFPEMGIHKLKPHYAFAGIRTLAEGDGSKSTGALSRRHSWIYSSGMLNLLGGKFTDANATVLEGFRMLCRLANFPVKIAPLTGRRFPGALIHSDNLTSDFLSECKARAVPQKIVARTLSRLGSLVRFLKKPQHFEVIDQCLLRGELELALDLEQAETLEDLMRRHLELEFLPGNGVELIEQIGAIMSNNRPHLNLGLEKKGVLDRLEKLSAVIGQGKDLSNGKVVLKSQVV